MIWYINLQNSKNFFYLNYVFLLSYFHRWLDEGFINRQNKTGYLIHYFFRIQNRLCTIFSSQKCFFETPYSPVSPSPPPPNPPPPHKAWVILGICLANPQIPMCRCRPKSANQGPQRRRRIHRGRNLIYLVAE